MVWNEITSDKLFPFHLFLFGEGAGVGVVKSASVDFVLTVKTLSPNEKEGCWKLRLVLHVWTDHTVIKNYSIFRSNISMT